MPRLPHATALALCATLTACGALVRLGPERELVEDGGGGTGTGGQPGGGGGIAGMGGGVPMPDPSCPDDSTVIWARRFGEGAVDVAQAAAPGLNGGAFVAGAFAGSLDLGGAKMQSAGGLDAYLARFNADGEVSFNFSFGDALDHPGGIHLAPTHDGDVVGTRWFQGTIDLGGGPMVSNGLDDLDGFVVRLSPTGLHRWSQHFSGAGNQSPWATATHPLTGNIIVVGSFENTMTVDGATFVSTGLTDIFLMELDGEDGQLLDAVIYGGPAHDYGNDVVVDAEGRIYILGEARSAVDFGLGPMATEPSAYGYVVAFDDFGVAAWDRQFLGPDRQKGIDLHLDETAEQLIAAVEIQGSTDLGDGPVVATFGSGLVRLDMATGAHIASRAISQFPTPSDMALTPDGNLMVVGPLNGPSDFGDGPVAPIPDSTNLFDQDGVIATYDPSFELVDYLQVGGSGIDNVNAIAATPDGAIVTGYFRFGYTPPGCLPLESKGDADVLLMKLAW